VAALNETFGKYVLLEKLATGGMAEVFLARGTGAGGIGKFFAVKRILPQFADSPEFIDMFRDEAKIAINLSHSNIVSIHEFGVEKGQFFLVMDYVEGRNLRQILNKLKKSGLRLSTDQITYLIKEVSAGLEYAHRCLDGSTGRPLNITHRDMSPQNIMVSFEGETKIVDFGIAKAESQLDTTRAGTLKGKFGYMSPEQADGQPVDSRTDIFSLGIVLWELLANDRLFVANNEVNTLRKIRDCQIPSLRKINPNLHSELERIVLKSLARDRNLRYQTAAALHKDLSRFLNRQFPDFNAQDFSRFIKEIFADEIMGIRKRLLDYAKINLTPSENFNERMGKSMSGHTLTSTGLLDPNTNSIVPTDTSSGDGAPKELSVRFQMTGVTIPSQPSVGELTKTHPSQNNAITGATTGLTTGLTTGATAVSNPSLGVLPSNTLPSLAPANPTTSILDAGALEREAERKIDIQHSPPSRQDGPAKPLETERIAPEILAKEKRQNVFRGPQVRATSARSGTSTFVSRVGTLLVFAALCSSAYAYLVANYQQSPPVQNLIVMTDPYLRPVHQALGIDISRTVASPKTNSEKKPTAAPSQAQRPIPAPTPIPPVTQPLATETSGLVVQSNPSGAEIYINDQNTGIVTPGRVEVSTSGTFSIALKKRGYYEVRKREVTRESLGHRVDATLQKMNVGYVNIEIFPPQEAVLFVNGKEVATHRNVVQDVMVPGNTPVKIRAESRSQNTYDEVIITVPTDAKRNVNLNPRKTPRSPAQDSNQ